MFDGTDGKECNQVYAITAAAAASAIASCRPSGPLQSTQEVAVWAKYSAERHVLEVTGAFPHPTIPHNFVVTVLLMLGA